MAKNSNTIELPKYNDWNCDDWIEFHKVLKKRYGRKEANKIFSQFFNNKPIGWTRDAVCTANDDFIKYFKSQGVKFDKNLYTLIDEGGRIVTFVTNNIYWILGGVAVGAAVFLVAKYYLTKKGMSIGVASAASQIIGNNTSGHE